MSNMVEYGREMKPSLGHVIRIWWAYTWRSFVFSLVGGLGVGLVLSFLLPPLFAQILGIAAAIVVAFASQLVAFRAIIGTNLNGFRLAVLQDTAKTEKAEKAKLNASNESTDKMIKAMKELSELSKK